MKFVNNALATRCSSSLSYLILGVHRKEGEKGGKRRKSGLPRNSLQLTLPSHDSLRFVETPASPSFWRRHPKSAMRWLPFTGKLQQQILSLELLELSIQTNVAWEPTH